MTGLCVLLASVVPYVMRYAEPADTWNEALPVGNGRLGAMVFGGTRTERLQLNEDTFWASVPNANVEPAMRPHLLEARRLCLEGRPDAANAYLKGCGVRVSKHPGSDYQTLGSLLLRFDGHAAATDYRRTLSLDDAVQTTEYALGGVTYRRETFASLADDVIVVRLTADRPKALSFDVWYESPFLRGAVPASDGADITLAETADWQYEIGPMVRAFLRTHPVVEGDAAESAEGVLSVRAADAVTLFVSVGTSFADYRHSVAAYRAQIAACDLDLGAERHPERTVPERLAAVARGEDDPHLEALILRYGRYLLVSSSQPGTQPANLQGLWNEWRQPPWRSAARRRSAA